MRRPDAPPGVTEALIPRMTAGQPQNADGHTGCPEVKVHKKTAAGGLVPAAACNQPEGGEPDYDRIRAKGLVNLASIA